MNKKIRLGYVLNSLNDIKWLCHCDVILVHPSDLIRINLKTELSGKSSKLTELAKLSEKVKGLLLIYAETDNFGIVQKSIIVLRCGKLISICDKTVARVGEKPSFGFKMCEVDSIKCGVLVDDDILELSGLQSFSSLQCDLVLNILKTDLKINLCGAVETLSYIYGIRIASLCDNRFIATLSDEKIAEKRNDYGEIILDIGHKYYETINKKRGT